MLIKCKECGKEISSQAEICPNCGYKNEKTMICPHCKEDTGRTYFEIQKFQMDGYSYGCKNCGKVIRVTTPEEELRFKQMQSSQTHCPYCNSTNVEKISSLSKVGSVAMFGIFSQKVKHQWHCNECKSDF